MKGVSVPQDVLEQAAEWMVRLQHGATDAERADCDRWRNSDPRHGLAWERAERLMSKLGGLPPELAMPVLNRPTGPARRAALARIAALLLAVPVGWAGWRYARGDFDQGDLHTAVGQRRTVTLADGSSVTLNTATSIDVRYTAAERLIVLRRGEILIRSGADEGRRIASGSSADPAYGGADRGADRGSAHGDGTGPTGWNRPLRVATAEGILQPLGTRFNVRQRDGATDLAVLEGAVRITPTQARGGQLVIPAGRQASFSASHISAPADADLAAIAWTTGMLLADQMPLSELTEELRRYRTGIVQIDPGLAGLRVSGAFPIADTERTLAMLSSTYGVKTLSRFGGYWITLAPAR